MNKLLSLLIVVPLLLVSCATFGTAPPCTLYEQYGATPENSLIAAKIKDPCAANRIITVVAKMPVIQYEEEYIEQFNLWAEEIKIVIANGATYKSIQDMLLLKVAQLNMKAGLSLFILTEGILVFDTVQVILPKDVELLVDLIDNLKREVSFMGRML
jgi:hypothetical protein